MIGILLSLFVQAVPDARLARAVIVFDARASVADFKGKTQAATGALTGGAGLGDVRGWIEVRWRDIDTGNGMRNGHMLRTVDDDHYPTIRLELLEVVRAANPADSPTLKDSLGPPGTRQPSVAGMLRGELTLHGVTRQVEWPATLQLERDSLRAAADFPLDIRDYGIKPPVKFLIARMGPIVLVHVRLVFVRTP